MGGGLLHVLFRSVTPFRQYLASVHCVQAVQPDQLPLTAPVTYTEMAQCISDQLQFSLSVSHQRYILEMLREFLLRAYHRIMQIRERSGKVQTLELWATHCEKSRNSCTVYFALCSSYFALCTLYLALYTLYFVLWDIGSYSPGQALIWQLFDCLNSPSQFFPPCLGLGFLQSRFLTLVPVPHVLLHGDQALHSEKPPFTDKKEK